MFAPFEERGRARSWPCPRPCGLETAPGRGSNDPQGKGEGLWRAVGHGVSARRTGRGRGEAHEGAEGTEVMGAGKSANVERGASKRRVGGGAGGWGELWGIG
jgi:hypothetical protein